MGRRALYSLPKLYMYRRSFLTAVLGAAALHAKNRIDLSRVSVLTDEIAKSPEEAIAFARQYGLRWVELRGLPGPKSPYYVTMPESQIVAAARQLKAAKLKVSFLNTGMLKYALPGAPPPKRANQSQEQYDKRIAADARQFENRMEALNKAIRTAEILGTRKIRIFGFTRVQQPAEVFPRIAEVMKEMAPVAKKAGMSLLIENEASCNIATSAELAEFIKLVPEPIGINWDPINALHRGETVPWPDGYKALPMKRVGNVQLKAEGLVIGKPILDWRAIFNALDEDGYKGQVGLETHVFDGTLIEKAHLSMKELQRLLGANT